MIRINQNFLLYISCIFDHITVIKGPVIKRRHCNQELMNLQSHESDFLKSLNCTGHKSFVIRKLIKSNEQLAEIYRK